VIILAVWWYLRYGLSFRDVEELPGERFTPLLIDAARPCRHYPGERWFGDDA
jgi:transposase-like protein